MLVQPGVLQTEEFVEEIIESPQRGLRDIAGAVVPSFAPKRMDSVRAVAGSRGEPANLLHTGVDVVSDATYLANPPAHPRDEIVDEPHCHPVLVEVPSFFPDVGEYSTGPDAGDGAMLPVLGMGREPRRRVACDSAGAGHEHSLGLPANMGAGVPANRREVLEFGLDAVFEGVWLHRLVQPRSEGTDPAPFEPAALDSARIPQHLTKLQRSRC